jgi:hypothetical protein
MKKLLFFLILPLQLFSQTEIDQIRSDSDVVNFIRTQGPMFVDSIHRPYLKPVTFDIFGRSRIYREKMDADEGHFTDSIMATRWMVEDFTGDHQKELVFYGRIGSETGVFVFFSGNGNSGHLIQLTDMFARAYPHSIELYKKGNVNLLILGSLEQPEWPVKDQKSIRERYFRDTLVYKFGYFTNYNEAPKKGLSFDSIEYRFVTNWMAINKWYMRIYKNGTALYVRERDSVVRAKKEVFSFLEKLTMKIDPGEWQAILDYIKFENLDEKYELKNVSDQTTGLTTVYFSDGTKKTVRDYGLRGTFGLQALYHKFYRMGANSEWELVKKITGYLYNNPQF